MTEGQVALGKDDWIAWRWTLGRPKLFQKNLQKQEYDMLTYQQGGISHYQILTFKPESIKDTDLTPGWEVQPTTGPLPGFHTDISAAVVSRTM
ncbi:hypothetical protein YC2023_033753 [Brassica napus]